MSSVTYFSMVISYTKHQLNKTKNNRLFFPTITVNIIIKEEIEDLGHETMVFPR